MWLSSLLALAAFCGCAAKPASPSDAETFGYDLRIDGDDVSLAFGRALTIPEFLQLAQQVTSERYVYDGRQLASAGPVTLVGRIHCTRSAFPDFVSTMLHVHGVQANAHENGDGRWVEIQMLTGKWTSPELPPVK